MVAFEIKINVRGIFPFYTLFYTCKKQHMTILEYTHAIYDFTYFKKTDLTLQKGNWVI